MVACGCATHWGGTWEELTFTAVDSNEALRLQPAVPSGSQRFVGKGKGTKVIGNL